MSEKEPVLVELIDLEEPNTDPVQPYDRPAVETRRSFNTSSTRDSAKPNTNDELNTTPAQPYYRKA